MISRRNIFFNAVLFFMLTVTGFAQWDGDTLLVLPTEDSGLTLEAAIAADIQANDGSTPPANRVYVLQKNGAYVVNSTITNDGWPLVIRSERNAEGNMPIVVMINNDATSTNNPNFITFSGSVYLQGIQYLGYLDEKDDGSVDTTYQHYIPGGVLTSQDPGFDVVVDGCIMTQTRGQFLRTTAFCHKVVMTNNIFGNSGQMPRSNFGAGKIIDLRDVQCDTLVMQNNTIVNLFDRVIRHRGSTANLDYFLFDHNTLVNDCGYHGVMALGSVGNEVNITNNLFIDPFVFGQDTDKVRQSEFDEPRELDDFGLAKMTWISTDTVGQAAGNTFFVVSGNYYSISDENQAFYNSTIGPDWGRSAGVPAEGEILTSRIKNAISDADNAFVKEDISLVNVPNSPVVLAEWYRTSAIDGGAGKTKNTDNFPRDYSKDYDRKSYSYFRDTLDCTYDETTAAYRGAEGNYPAGDLNWYPELKAAWIESPLVNDVVRTSPVASDFTLEQNYPNPFNPATKIVYSIAKESKVSLEVFNILGQKVATLVNATQAVGQYDVNFNASELSTGIYIYRLSTGDFVSTKKMMLIK